MAGKLFCQRKHNVVYGDTRPLLLGACLQRNYRIGQRQNIPIQRQLFLLFRKKRRANRLRKLECGQSTKPICQRIGMDASSAQSENNQIEIASG